MFYLALCDDCKNDLQEIMECLGALKKENYRMEIMPYLTGSELIREYEIGPSFQPFGFGHVHGANKWY